MDKVRGSESHGKAGSSGTSGGFSKADAVGLLQGIALSGFIALLFYRAMWGFLVAILVVPFWMKKYRQSLFEKRRKQLALEFKEFMLLISASLQAGYSVEKAFKESEGEMDKLFSKECILKEPIHRLNAKVAMNIPLEKAFFEMAEETDLEDAKNLADILSFAKRSGGDYGKHIRSTALKIEQKLSVQLEIDTMTSEKQLEMKVMSAMPLMILFYISVTSIEFIAPLYSTMLGRIVMSVCLIAYAFLITVSEKIVRIDV